MPALCPAALICPSPATPAAPQVHNIGDWWEARPDSPWLRMAEQAIRKEWGTDPLLVREGAVAGRQAGGMLYRHA